MEDIELVIKIPKEIYDYIHEHIALRVCDGHKVAKAIANGTPLPKGHGDLIDRSEVEKLDDKLCNTECGCCALENCFYYEARAIIKADKAESEGLPNNICTQKCCLKNHNVGIIECNEEYCSNRTKF